jgi:hypothetical protein
MWKEKQRGCQAVGQIFKNPYNATRTSGSYSKSQGINIMLIYDQIEEILTQFGSYTIVQN